MTENYIFVYEFKVINNENDLLYKFILSWIMMKNYKFLMTGSGTGSQDVRAHLCWVEIVLDKALNDGRQLRLDEELAGLLEPADNLPQHSAQLRHKLDNLLLGLVAGDKVVDVRDDVGAEGAGQLVPGGRQAGGQQAAHH